MLKDSYRIVNLKKIESFRENKKGYNTAKIKNYYTVISLYFLRYQYVIPYNVRKFNNFLLSIMKDNTYSQFTLT